MLAHPARARVKLNGHIHNGKQNHLCKDCGRQFVLNPAQKLVSEKDRGLIGRLLLEKISLAGIARAAEVSEPWHQGYTAGYMPPCPAWFLWCAAQESGNYWLGSGTPRFLIKMLKPGFRQDLKNVMADISSFDSYDISNLSIDTLLFQTGYLT